MSYSPKFKDIEACLRATHRQAWLARDLTRKVNVRKVTLNGEP